MAGVDVEVDFHNSLPSVVRLRDGAGHLLVVSGDYGLKVMVKAPPKVIKKWRLSGALPFGTVVDEVYEMRAQAELRRREVIGNENLEIEEIDVEEES